MIIGDFELNKQANEQRILRRIDNLSAGLMCVAIMQGMTIGILVLVYMW